MTRQKAIEILNLYDVGFCKVDTGKPIPAEEIVDAIDMAIEALEQQTCDKCKFNEETDGMNCYECLKGMTDNFEALQQEPKRGKWIINNYEHAREFWDKETTCSICGYKMGGGEPNYCPNCGARMESDEE